MLPAFNGTMSALVTCEKFISNLGLLLVLPDQQNKSVPLSVRICTEPLRSQDHTSGKGLHLDLSSFPLETCGLWTLISVNLLWPIMYYVHGMLIYQDGACCVHL